MMKIAMVGRLLRFGKRLLHTNIISRETIKPSSPTPPHLQTYNLSVIDRIIRHAYIPIVLFFPNYTRTSTNTTTPREKASVLKYSLSKTLTKYYPFAGQLKNVQGPYIHCNDEGVEFLEAHNDTQLVDFLHDIDLEHKNLAQVFPAGLIWDNPYSNNAGFGFGITNSTSLLVVQFSHFACGGIVVAVSMSHKIADGYTLCSFLNHWAAVSSRSDFSDHDRQVLPVNHYFLSSQSTTIDVQEHEPHDTSNCITKRFVFPNSKIGELKDKVQAMVTNPTRVEVLNSLLYKCAVKAATNTNLGSFRPSRLVQSVDMRGKMVEPLPTGSTCVMGNIALFVDVPTRSESEIELNTLAAQLRKAKVQLGGVRNLQMAYELYAETLSKVNNEIHIENFEYYFSTSFCRFSLYEVDFGWGKPVRVTLAGAPMRNCFILMDTPDGDGIEAMVTLEKQSMALFQKDKELLAFC